MADISSNANGDAPEARFFGKRAAAADKRSASPHERWNATLEWGIVHCDLQTLVELRVV